MDAIPVVRLCVGRAVLLLPAEVVPERELAARELVHVLVGDAVAPIDSRVPCLVYLLAAEVVVVVARKRNEIDYLVGNVHYRVTRLERVLRMVVAVVPDVDRDVTACDDARLALGVVQGAPRPRLVAELHHHLEHGVLERAELLGLPLVIFVRPNMHVRTDERRLVAGHVFGEKRLQPREDLGGLVEVKMIRTVFLRGEVGPDTRKSERVRGYVDLRDHRDAD